MPAPPHPLQRHESTVRDTCASVRCSTSRGADPSASPNGASVSSDRTRRANRKPEPAGLPREHRHDDRLGRRPDPRPVGRRDGDPDPVPRFEGVARSVRGERGPRSARPGTSGDGCSWLSRCVRLRIPVETSVDSPVGRDVAQADGDERARSIGGHGQRHLRETRAAPCRSSSGSEVNVRGRDRRRHAGRAACPRRPRRGTRGRSRARRAASRDGRAAAGAPGASVERPVSEAERPVVAPDRRPRVLGTPSAPAARRSGPARSTGSCIQARSIGSSMTPVSTPLQPVIPPAHALLQEADRGSGHALVRERVRPRPDQALPRAPARPSSSRRTAFV